MRPRGDPLIRRQHLVGRQLPAHQRGVAAVLGPPLHPGVLRRVLPPLLRLLRRDVHDRLGDRVAQPARGQPVRPAQHLLLRGPGLLVIQRRGHVHDDGDLGLPQLPRPVQRHRPGQPLRQAAGPGPSAARPRPWTRPAAPAAHRRRTHPTAPACPRAPPARTLLGTPADELRDGQVLPRRRVGLDPVPRRDHPVQLAVRRARVPVIIPGRGISQERQRARRPAARPRPRPSRTPPATATCSPGQLRIRLLFLVPARTGRLVIDRPGVAPGFPVLRGHPVRSRNGVTGLGASARVSRSSRHEHHPVRNERSS